MKYIHLHKTYQAYQRTKTPVQSSILSGVTRCGHSWLLRHHYNHLTGCVPGYGDSSSSRWECLLISMKSCLRLSRRSSSFPPSASPATNHRARHQMAAIMHLIVSRGKMHQIPRWTRRGRKQKGCEKGRHHLQSWTSVPRQCYAQRQRQRCSTLQMMN